MTEGRTGSVRLEDLHAEAELLLVGVTPGAPLDDVAAALIGLAVHSSVCTLDAAGTDDAMRRALDAGASPAQVHETLVLVAALGVHTLMEGTRQLSSILRERGAEPSHDPDRAALRSRLQGDDSYWKRFEEEVPGFLDALLDLSPTAYEAFFAFCAVPWQTGTVPPLLKELVSMACDATGTHRYLPGLRLHLSNAVKLGAGAASVRQALDIAAAAPPPPGVPAAH